MVLCHTALRYEIFQHFLSHFYLLPAIFLSVVQLHDITGHYVQVYTYRVGQKWTVKVCNSCIWRHRKTSYIETSSSYLYIVTWIIATTSRLWSEITGSSWRQYHWSSQYFWCQGKQYTALMVTGQAAISVSLLSQCSSVGISWPSPLLVLIKKIIILHV